MYREGHLQIDRFFWGQEYDDVHAWLDKDFHLHKPNPYRHWIERHNKKAIAEKYGQYTVRYNVAYLHILCDWLQLGVAEVPETEEDVKILLKCLGYL